MLDQELAQIPQSFAQLVQDLDRDTKRYLSDILAQEHTTGDELIRNLIRNHWLALNHHLALSTQIETAQQTVQQTTQPEIQSSQLEPQIELAFASELALVSSIADSTVMASLPELYPVTPCATAAHKPRNSKQMIAEFVRRKNQRSWSF
jgi:hypothetical protein